jgi:predicted nucleotidyltransferase
MDNLFRGVIAVPKAEIDRREEQWRKQQAKKKRAKKVRYPCSTALASS